MVKLSREEREFLESPHIARIGTVSNRGMPHVVPVCYAVHNDDIFIPVDVTLPRKKTNIEQESKICLAVDHYDNEDWSKLKGVVIQGEVEVIKGGKEFLMARDLIYQRYPLFEKVVPIKEGKTHWIIKIKPTRIASWGIKKVS